MNDNFLKLEEPKKQAIITAAMKVFSQNAYAHANTEEIARIAGISKGALFYYFKNKESLFHYLCEYCEAVTLTYLNQIDYETITDFFEVMRAGAKAKTELIQQHPYLMEFILKVWYGKDIPIQKEVLTEFHASTQDIMQKFFSCIDRNKFKEGVDILELYKMLSWMSEGYLFEKISLQQPIHINDMMEEFYHWEDFFKRHVYKEDYL